MTNSKNEQEVGNELTIGQIVEAAHELLGGLESFSYNAIAEDLPTEVDDNLRVEGQNREMDYDLIEAAIEEAYKMMVFVTGKNPDRLSWKGIRKVVSDTLVYYGKWSEFATYGAQTGGIFG